MAEKKTTTTTHTAPVNSNGLAIASMVCGIVAFVFGWAAFFGFVVGAVAIVLGIIGLKKTVTGKGMAIAGIVTGAVAALWSIVVTILFIVVLATAGVAGTAIGGALNQYNTETKALINQRKDFVKGETAVFGNLELKVTSTERNFTPDNRYYGPSEGNEFVVVDVHITNLNNEPEYVNKYDFAVVEDGEVIATSFVNIDGEFAGENLASGASTDGKMVFEVTKGASNLKLQYQTTVYDLEDGSKTLVYTIGL